MDRRDTTDGTEGRKNRHMGVKGMATTGRRLPGDEHLIISCFTTTGTFCPLDADRRFLRRNAMPVH